MSDQKLNISYFSRKPKPGHYSIEFLFKAISQSMGDKHEVRWLPLPYFSSGIWPRIQSTFWAKRHQSQINHVVGDVHFLTLALDTRKTILTIHDCGFVEKASGLKKWWLKKLWIDWPVKRSAKVTTISSQSKRDIVNLTGCHENHVVVVPNFVSENFVPPSVETKNEKFVILHVGTKANKNLSRTIKAVAKLNCKLNIVGRLNQRQLTELKELNIDFENFIDAPEDQLITIYQQSDMLSFVSLEEGFGLPILEAQRCGLPVMTSQIAAMPETAGEGALLVDPYKIDAIREGIQKIMEEEDFRQSLIQKGFENVKRFSLNSTVAQYEQIYLQVAQQ